MSRDLKAPDHTTLSRRNQIVVVPPLTRAHDGPIDLSLIPQGSRFWVAANGTRTSTRHRRNAGIGGSCTSERMPRGSLWRPNSQRAAGTTPPRVAPRIVRIYTLRGFESVLAGSVQVSTGTKTSLSFQDGPVFTRVHRREGPAAPRGSRPRTHGTTISQPTWPGVPQIAFIRLTGRAPGQQSFEILEDLVGYVATELNANPRDLDLYARRGLLKGEQLHALARCVHYGRLGRLDQRDFERQTGAASCLLLILAAIIYT